MLLGIHDPAFPSRPGEDVGRGSPCSEGAWDFLCFIRALGFDGVQLGPQGMTAPDNPSPYDGTLFSRNPLSLAFLSLARSEWGRLISPESLAGAVASRRGPPDRVVYAEVHPIVGRLVGEAVGARRGRVTRAFLQFCEKSSPWLMRDALYDQLEREAKGRSWDHWPNPMDRALWAPPPGMEAVAEARRRELQEAHRESIEDYAFVQYLLHAQHRELRSKVRRLGLRLFGDLQIGMSQRDAWVAQGFTLRGYFMGAPPSRTNPEGQPWGYPVLDPRCYFERTSGGLMGEGPAVRFLRSRMEKLFEEYDGVRIDHPHGLVCPWVYAAESLDPLGAVQTGARLFASPDLPDHPGLARFAIPRPEQLDRSVPRYADGWVKDLEPDQLDRYAVLFEKVVDAAGRNGRGLHEIACEILSTQPYPIRRVMDRHGLGRFRVTQKVDLRRAEDVYRSENARPEDWIMLGNHDTRPIWLAVEEWSRTGVARAHAEYLAQRLLTEGEDRDAWTRRVARDPEELAQAKFAELFVGPAQNVMVYFTDLLGFREPYNRPGSVGGENWSLRVPADFRRLYRICREGNRALNVPRALARALRSRGRDFSGSRSELIAALDRLAADPSG